MSNVAIRVENLSKAYRIGLKEEISDTFMGAVTGWLKAPLHNLRRLRRLNTFNVAGESNGHAGGNGQAEEDDIVWALKDVSFEVQEGEVLGIIGRNGAGKSTLLKILSRITEPTSGQAVIHGRVSSLLEVGTGFHPELTGRENIYMNGTILGMRKREIDRKFDEIVEFSGVEKFLDTPVKRYSSGMTVRLAFSVAAHLEPEVLVVDEVLAVGDSQFQKKCLGKMGEVAREGRTVLLVSHNMHVVRNLCQRGALLDGGQIVTVGQSHDVVDQYLASADCLPSQKTWDDPEAPATDKMRLLRVAVLDEAGEPSSIVRIDRAIGIEIVYDVMQDLESGYAAFWLKDSAGTEVLSTSNSPQVTSTPDEFCGKPMKRGRYRSVCWIPSDFVNARHYMVTPILGIGISQTQVLIRDVITFEVADTSDMRAEYQGGWLGVVRPKLPWSTARLGNGEMT